MQLSIFIIDKHKNNNYHIVEHKKSFQDLPAAMIDDFIITFTWQHTRWNPTKWSLGKVEYMLTLPLPREGREVVSEDPRLKCIKLKYRKKEIVKEA